MITLESTTAAKLRRRELADVQFIFNDNDTITARGTHVVTTLVDGVVTKRRSLASIELSGAALETALSTASLPSSTVIKTRLRNLFHGAWTNEIGVITKHGTENE